MPPPATSPPTASAWAFAVPLFVLCRIPLVSRSWFRRLLDLLALRVQRNPRVAKSAFTLLNGWPGPRNAVKSWLRYQLGVADLKNGNPEGALAHFSAMTFGIADENPWSYQLLRSAFSLVKTDRAVYGPLVETHRFAVASQPDMPREDLATFICGRGHRLEQVAAAQSGDAKLKTLREAFAEHSYVVGLQGISRDALERAARGQITSAVACGDLQEGHRRAVAHARVTLEPFRALLHAAAIHFPGDALPYYVAFAQQHLQGPTPNFNDLHCWLLNVAHLLLQADRVTAAGAALRLAEKIEPAGAFRWNIASRENFGVEITGTPPGVEVPFASLLALLTPPGLAPEHLVNFDAMLLEHRELGFEPDHAAAVAVKLLMDSGVTPDNAIAACRRILEPMGLGATISSATERLQPELHEAHVRNGIPGGLSEQAISQVLRLLLQLEQGGRRKKETRDILEEIGEYSMDVSPIEAKLEHLTWLAGLSLSHDCGSQAESWLHAAKSACSSYDNPSVRVPLMLALCQRMRASGLNQRFDAFYRSIAMEGRSQAATTWLHASGYTDRERNEFKSLQSEFENLLGLPP